LGRRRPRWTLGSAWRSRLWPTRGFSSRKWFSQGRRRHARRAPEPICTGSSTGRPSGGARRLASCLVRRVECRARRCGSRWCTWGRRTRACSDGRGGHEGRGTTAQSHADEQARRGGEGLIKLCGASAMRIEESLRLQASRACHACSSVERDEPSLVLSVTDFLYYPCPAGTAALVTVQQQARGGLAVQNPETQRAPWLHVGKQHTGCPDVHWPTGTRR